MPMKLAVGDIVRLRKVHPCGGFEWQVVRIGADIGLVCLTCKRRILEPRSEIEKRIKQIKPAATQAESDDRSLE